MTYTNLNIESSDYSFKYITTFSHDNSYSTNTKGLVIDSKNGIFFNNECQNVLANKNTWTDCDSFSTSRYIPSYYETSTLRVYFPRFSVDTYEKNVSYVLSINTWIGGTPVYLASIVINRNDSMASLDGPKRFLDDNYYEYIELQTIDPIDIIYSDTWKNFRTKLCGEPVNEDGSQVNNSGTAICVMLTPVRMVDGTWIKMDHYECAKNTIRFEEYTSNYLSTKLTLELLTKPVFNVRFSWNKVYSTLDEYLKETYGIDTSENFTLKIGLVIRDKDDAYKYVEHTYNGTQDGSQFEFDEFAFDSWEDFHEGLYANVLVVMQKEGEDILALTSNSIILHKDNFRYLLKGNLEQINLIDIDMNVNKYNVVNVIKNEIVTLERNNDYKANIIKPVFVKMQDAELIKLHEGIAENIAINLDAYKNKVEQFILKIGENEFYEVGRMSAGIVFKMTNVSLEQKQGIYYILNENSELVTTGKYEVLS